MAPGCNPEPSFDDVPFEDDPDTGYTDIAIPDETVRLGVLLGLMTFDQSARVYVLTATGREWLRSWCEDKLAEAEEKRAREAHKGVAPGPNFECPNCGVHYRFVHDCNWKP